MKDGNLMHRFNKHLLAGLGLVIIILAVGGYLLTQFKNKANTESVKVDQVKIEESPALANNIGDYDQGSIGQVKTLRQIDATDHVWGELTSPVQIIIYDDFECPYCAQYFDKIEQVKKDYAGKVAIAYRHFPLSNIHPTNLIAAEASECAAEQGKFWEMYTKLFEDNKQNKFSVEQWKLDAIALGLDKAKFNQCLDSSKYKTKIDQQLAEGSSFGVTGTPTTFINGEIIIGDNPYEDTTASDGRKIEGLKSIINRLLLK